MRWLILIPLGILLALILGLLAGLYLQLPLHRTLPMLASDEIRFALRLTLLTSGAATVIALALGIPAGYFLARHSFAGKVLVDALIDLPMTMPPLVAGVGLLFLLSNEAVEHALRALGIEFLFTPAGAVLAQVLIAAPIMTRACRAAFTSMDVRYEQAAQTLGLMPHQVFRRITLPMAQSMILSGLILCWARVVGEFGATLMVAGATRFKTETLPIAVYLNISSGEMGIALACAWLLILTAFAVLVVMQHIRPPFWMAPVNAKEVKQ